MKLLTSLLTLLLSVSLVYGGTIEDSLQGKTQKDKSRIKSEEIVKRVKSGTFTSGQYTIEIMGIPSVINDGNSNGLQVYARAWKNGQQLGFGSDGTVEIERFRIFNPPILVRDPNGTTTRDWIELDGLAQIPRQTKYREDPEEALRQTLVHTVSVSAKDGSNVIIGKIGNTTDTFYPDPGNPGTNSADGNLQQRNNATFAGAHDAASASDVDFDGTSISYIFNFQSGGYYIARGLYYFDTSSLPDGDTITSATFSLYYTAANAGGANMSTSVVGLSGTSGTNSYAASDYSKFGTTKLASDIAGTSVTLNTYTDFALNSDGLNNISKTSVSQFGNRESLDVANTANAASPTNLGASTADVSGTSQDPKLVVVHSASFIPTFGWFKFFNFR